MGPRSLRYRYINVYDAERRGERRVALIQLCDLSSIATSLDNVVVELVPESQSRQRWPRKSCKGIEIQAVDS